MRVSRARAEENRRHVMIKEHVQVLSRRISGAAEKPDGKVTAILSTMVGAVTLARAINDPGLAQFFLNAAAESIRGSQRNSAKKRS